MDFFLLAIILLIVFIVINEFKIKEDYLIFHLVLIPLFFPSTIDIYKYADATKEEISNGYFTLTQYFLGFLKYNWVSHLLLFVTANGYAFFSKKRNFFIFY